MKTVIFQQMHWKPAKLRSYYLLRQGIIVSGCIHHCASPEYKPSRNIPGWIVFVTRTSAGRFVMSQQVLGGTFSAVILKRSALFCHCRFSVWVRFNTNHNFILSSNFMKFLAWNVNCWHVLPYRYRRIFFLPVWKVLQLHHWIYKKDEPWWLKHVWKNVCLLCLLIFTEYVLMGDCLLPACMTLGNMHVRGCTGKITATVRFRLL